MCGPTHDEIQTHLDKVFNQMRSYDVVSNSVRWISGGTDPEQFCRTCGRADQRVSATLAEITAARAAGRDLAELSCAPDKPAALRRIHQDRSVTPVQIGRKPSSDEGKVAINLARRPDKAVVALAETCGQAILAKCVNCRNLERQVVRVPGGVNANGRTFYVEVLLGGHCKIPVEGIVVNGRRVTCHRQIRVFDTRDETRNCSTCRYQFSYGQDSMLDHATPLVGFGLNPYESDVLVDREAGEIGLQTWQARIQRSQVRWPVGPNTKNTSLTWFGLIKNYRLPLVKIHEDELAKRHGVDVRLPNGAVHTFALAESDERVGLVDIVSTNWVHLRILAPYHRGYGLPDADRFSYAFDKIEKCWSCGGTGFHQMLNTNRYSRNFGQFEAVPCSTCLAVGGRQPAGSGQAQRLPGGYEVIVNDLSDRVSPICKFCDQRRHVPCYHHAKKSVEREEVVMLPLINGKTVSETRRTQDYKDPSVSRFDAVEAPNRILRLDRSTDPVRVTDANGDVPDFFIFRVWYRSILEWCNDATERTAVSVQFAEAKARCDQTRPRSPDLGWNRVAPGDPWHPQCAVNVFDKTHRPGRTMAPDVTVTYMEGAHTRTDIFTRARGLDFTRMWNDQFGTPRSDQSTNPVRSADYGVITGIDGRRIGQRGLGLDEKFSWPKWQVNEEWLRVHADGEVVQDEFLASEHHLVQGRRTHGGNPWIGFGDKDPIVVKLGVGVPNTALEFDSTIAAMAWLNEPREMPGNDEAKGFVATNRWFALGYENFRNTKRLMDDDIPSVFEFNQTPASLGDESSDAAEGVGHFVCTRCYDPTDEGGAGRYDPSEVNTVDLSCPNPDCDGVLVFLLSDEEWRQGHMQIDSDQIDPDESYRRRSGAPDTTYWQSTGRLQNMGCPFWSPRRRSFRPVQ